MPELLDGAGMEAPAAAEAAAGGSTPSAGGRLTAVRRWARSHAIALAGLPLAAIVLFTLYLHEARTAPLNGDGAGNALQAWDMLHGNLLLSHWSVSDVNFYLTELPEYMLVEAVHGLSGDVTHIAAALTYTLAVLLACWLARGRARGAQAVVRVLIVLVIMLAAPGPGVGTVVLLDSPDHFGTSVPVLLIYLVLDRLPRRRSTLVLLFLMLVWAGTSDSTVFFLAVGGVAVVAGLRLWRGEGDRRYDGWLLAVAVLTAGVAEELPKLISRLGGFSMHPPAMLFNTEQQMPQAFWQSIGSFLQLFGADFFGLSPVTAKGNGGLTVDVNTVIVLLHLIGAALAAVALAKVARRLRGADPGNLAGYGDDDSGAGARGDNDLVVRMITVGVLLNLAALVFSSQYTGGGREIAGTMPLAAVVAARTLAPRMGQRKHIAVFGAFAVLFGAVLVHHASAKSQPPYAHSVEVWLKQNGYTYGLGGYWTSHSISVDSGGTIQVSPVNTGPKGITQYDWEAKSTWYDPDQHYANFLVVDLANPSALKYATPQQAAAQFGPPERTVPIGGWEILIWNKNLLAGLPAPSG